MKASKILSMGVARRDGKIYRYDHMRKLSD